MVTKIISGKSIRGLLNYNETKVEKGDAKLIMASRFGMDMEKLDRRAKIRRFEHLTSLNPRVKTNALHIMLNFDRKDSRDINLLQQVAEKYMDKIGFGEQPYLIYYHQDVSHPHLHIVTTNIKTDGRRIDIHNIGKTLSETARKELEEEYNLIKAEGRNKNEALNIAPFSLEKVDYGNAPTKRAINTIVSAVLRTYRFTSLAEYNAVLNQFNIKADRGKEDTQIFKKRGLVYSILDNQGKRIGVPFKASLLTGRPTLARVEKKYELNREKRESLKGDLKERIEKVMKLENNINKNSFTRGLSHQQIGIAFRENEEGFIFGITYIDHKNKTVFNGSSLGKALSAKAITERIANANKSITAVRSLISKKASDSNDLQKDLPNQSNQQTYKDLEFLELLLKTGKSDDYSFFIPKRKKKRKFSKQQDQELGL